MCPCFSLTCPLQPLTISVWQKLMFFDYLCAEIKNSHFSGRKLTTRAAEDWGVWWSGKIMDQNEIPSQQLPYFPSSLLHPIFITKRDFLSLLLNMRKSFHGRKFCFAFLNWSVTFMHLIISLHHFKVNVQCGHECLNWGPQFFNVCVMLNI